MGQDSEKAIEIQEDARNKRWAGTLITALAITAILCVGAHITITEVARDTTPKPPSREYSECFRLQQYCFTWNTKDWPGGQTSCLAAIKCRVPQKGTIE
jgi:hypothetical protein